MPSWYPAIIQLLPILSVLGPLVTLGIFYWLKDKFPTKADFDVLKGQVTKLDSDVTKLAETTARLQDERDDPPTRVDLMEELSSLAERMGAVEARTEGIGKALNTANEYLQILVQQGLSR